MLFHTHPSREIACLLLLSLLLLCGCAAERPESSSLDVAAAAAVQETSPSVTVSTAHPDDEPAKAEPVALSVPSVPPAQSEEEMLAAQFRVLMEASQDRDRILMDVIERETPELAAALDAAYPDLCLLCLTDILSPENSEVIRCARYDRDLPEEISPQLRMEYELLHYLVETYEPSESEIVSAEQDAYEWFSWYYSLEFCQGVKKNGFNLEAPFYQEHPIQKQCYIAMLREPAWRMPALTPLQGPCYDQESYVDAWNAFYFYLDSGRQDPKLTVSAAPDDLEALCTETAVWTMSQAEDHSVTLNISLETGAAFVLQYIP